MIPQNYLPQNQAKFDFWSFADSIPLPQFLYKQLIGHPFIVYPVGFDAGTYSSIYIDPKTHSQYNSTHSNSISANLKARQFLIYCEGGSQTKNNGTYLYYINSNGQVLDNLHFPMSYILKLFLASPQIATIFSINPLQVVNYKNKLMITQWNLKTRKVDKFRHLLRYKDREYSKNFIDDHIKVVFDYQQILQEQGIIDKDYQLRIFMFKQTSNFCIIEKMANQLRDELTISYYRLLIQNEGDCCYEQKDEFNFEQSLSQLRLCKLSQNGLVGLTKKSFLGNQFVIYTWRPRKGMPGIKTVNFVISTNDTNLNISQKDSCQILDLWELQPNSYIFYLKVRIINLQPQFQNESTQSIHKNKNLTFVLYPIWKDLQNQQHYGISGSTHYGRVFVELAAYQTCFQIEDKIAQFCTPYSFNFSQNMELSQHKNRLKRPQLYFMLSSPEILCKNSQKVTQRKQSDCSKQQGVEQQLPNELSTPLLRVQSGKLFKQQVHTMYPHYCSNIRVEYKLGKDSEKLVKILITDAAIMGYALIVAFLLESMVQNEDNQHRQLLDISEAKKQKIEVDEILVSEVLKLIGLIL